MIKALKAFSYQTSLRKSVCVFKKMIVFRRVQSCLKSILFRPFWSPSILTYDHEMWVVKRKKTMDTSGKNKLVIKTLHKDSAQNVFIQEKLGIEITFLQT